MNRDFNQVVFIADELGVYSAFNNIKTLLAEDNVEFINLIYFILSDKEENLFKAELHSLEKRFANKLEVKILRYNNNKDILKNKIKDSIEIALNCSIDTNIYFFIKSKQYFVQQIKDFLVFLGVKLKNIEIENF